MKRTNYLSVIAAVLVICTLFIPSNVNATQSLPTTKDIIRLENGDYLETTITSSPAVKSYRAARSKIKDITKTKTTSYKNSAGAVMWSVSITATFYYDGTSATCVSCSHSASAPGKSWSIKSVSSSKSGNSATAVATATHSTADFTQSVTISCNRNGVVY